MHGDDYDINDDDAVNEGNADNTYAGDDGNEDNDDVDVDVDGVYLSA